MSIFGSELIPTKKFVAHHPDADRIDGGDAVSVEGALSVAYDEMDDLSNGDRIAVSNMCEWMPTIDGESLIEELQQAAYDHCGEIADGFLDEVSPGDCSILALRVQSIVREWLHEIYPEPRGMPFWMAGETVYCNVQLPLGALDAEAITR